ncbi:MAG: PepSY domain-containing protein [Steroidobacteraceae bacterium]
MKTLQKLTALSAVAILATGAFVQLAIASSNAPAALAAKATITLEAAAKTARARVAGGSIVSAELEHEHGALVWSFDLAQRNTRNITEVQVDAQTGKIVALETETTADQAKEDHADTAD